MVGGGGLGTHEVTRFTLTNANGGKCATKLDSLAHLSERRTLLVLRQRSHLCTSSKVQTLSARSVVRRAECRKT